MRQVVILEVPSNFVAPAKPNSRMTSAIFSRSIFLGRPRFGLSGLVIVSRVPSARHGPYFILILWTFQFVSDGLPDEGRHGAPRAVDVFSDG